MGCISVNITKTNPIFKVNFKDRENHLRGRVSLSCGVSKNIGDLIDFDGLVLFDNEGKKLLIRIA